MIEADKRLKYLVPIAVIAALALVEKVFRVPDVVDGSNGGITHTYKMLFSSDGLRYTEAMQEIGKGLAILDGPPGGRYKAAEHFRRANDLFGRVNRRWTFEQLPQGLHTDRIDQLKRDLAAVSGELEMRRPAENTPQAARVLQYVKLARATLPNGGII